MGTQKQQNTKNKRPWAKLLHSKPTHSFTNSHSQAALLYLFYFILFYFIFGKLMQHLSPKKFKDEYSFHTFFEKKIRQI
jgi:hypothetical protein